MPFDQLPSGSLIDTQPKWELVPKWTGILQGEAYDGPVFVQKDLFGNITQIVPAL